MFLWLRQSRLAGSIKFHIRGRSSDRLFVTNLVNTIFWKRMNRLRCKLPMVYTGQGGGMSTLRVMGVKGQRHTTPKLDLETWRRHHFRPFRSSRFSSESYELQWTVCILHLRRIMFSYWRASKDVQLQFWCGFIVVRPVWQESLVFSPDTTCRSKLATKVAGVDAATTSSAKLPL